MHLSHAQCHDVVSLGGGPQECRSGSVSTLHMLLLKGSDRPHASRQARQRCVAQYMLLNCEKKVLWIGDREGIDLWKTTDLYLSCQRRPITVADRHCQQSPTEEVAALQPRPSLCKCTVLVPAICIV